MRYRKENGQWLPTTPIGVSREEFDEVKQDLTHKQDSEDNTLATDSKTIVGGINELNEKVNDLQIKYVDKVATTDASGDVSGILSLSDGIAISAMTLRNYGDGCYASWANALLAINASNTWCVKVVNDAFAPLKSTKVAIRLYYI